MSDDNKIAVYARATGRKQRVPGHFLDVFPDLFRKTPLSKAQEAKLAKATVDADKVAAKADADAKARQVANRAGVLPQIPGAVGLDTAGGDSEAVDDTDGTPTDSTDGDNTNDPANGATTEGDS